MSEKNNQVESESVPNSLVFISHDTKDAEIAEAFTQLLKRVSAGVLKSFSSSDKKGSQGIEYGVEWYPEIIKHIRNATDVVCLLTPNSVNRPWLLFEAGMAKGKLDTPILGVAVGISLKKASSGPFAQFQNCNGDEESLCKLVFQLVDRIPNAEPDEETIKFHVQKFISSIEDILTKRKENQGEDDLTEYNENDTPKLFEEIKVMFQDLPSRIENRILPINNEKSLSRRVHPKIIHEIIHNSPTPEMGIIIALSFAKEKYPWLYEIGFSTLNTIQSKNPSLNRIKAFEDFRQLVKFIEGTSLMEDVYIGISKEDYMIFRELPTILMQAFRNLLENKTNRKI